ncbi:MAG TPA: hypothetical protein VLH19_04030, partial [Patescibacteria group bacterium]|nr:hypothetical protein [Patescibacteria group bacterium]
MDSQQYRRKFVGGDIEITVEYKPPNADQKIGEVILRDPSGCEISVPEAIMADIAHWGRESRIAAQTAAEK